MCCGWAGSGAIDCPDPKVISGVRKYFFEEALEDELFLVPPKVLVVDGSVPLLSWKE